MTHTRILEFEGGRNFRDMGGYPTIDGRRVKWRTLFRSGTLTRLSAADLDAVDALSIRSVYDFRTDEERRAEPHPWPRTSEVSVYFRDYVASAGELRRLAELPMPTVDHAREAMFTIYRTLPYEQADAYRRLFQGAVSGPLPLLFNCSAGKDRTGVAAALMLSALGVEEDAIIEDFVLTEQAFDFRKLRGPTNERSAQWGLNRLPGEVLDVLIGARPDFLAATFDELERRSGGLEGYLERELGVGPNEIEALRERLLEG